MSDLHSSIQDLRSSSSPEDLNRIKTMIDAHDLFIFDCDGVIWTGKRTYAFAKGVIDFLQALGKTVFFITNNSTKTRQMYADKMLSKGFTAPVNRIHTSGSLAAQYMAKHMPEVKAAYVVGEAGIADELRQVGVRVVGGEDHKGDIDVSEEAIAERVLDREVGAVVVGWDRHFSFAKLAIASLYLQNAQERKDGCLLLATNLDAYDKVTPTRNLPGGGCMVACVREGCRDQRGNKPPLTVAGKPNPFAVELLIDQLGVKRNRICMIGDRLDTDIAMAGEAKISSICVLSGVSCLADLRPEAFSGPCDPVLHPPTYLVDDISAFLAVKHLYGEDSTVSV